jgi:hypothetical protein
MSYIELDDIGYIDDKDALFKKGCFRLIDLMNLVENAQRMKMGNRGREIILNDIANQIILIIEIYLATEELEKYQEDYLDMEKIEISELEEGDKIEIMATLKEEFKPIASNNEDLYLIENYRKDTDKLDGF